MQDFDELKKLKAQCLADITEALPDYVNRQNSTCKPWGLHLSLEL